MIPDERTAIIPSTNKVHIVILFPNIAPIERFLIGWIDLKYKTKFNLVKDSILIILKIMVIGYYQFRSRFSFKRIPFLESLRRRFTIAYLSPVETVRVIVILIEWCRNVEHDQIWQTKLVLFCPVSVETCSLVCNVILFVLTISLALTELV